MTRKFIDRQQSLPHLVHVDDVVAVALPQLLHGAARVQTAGRAHVPVRVFACTCVCLCLLAIGFLGVEGC